MPVADVGAPEATAAVANGTAAAVAGEAGAGEADDPSGSIGTRAIPAARGAEAVATASIGPGVAVPVSAWPGMPADGAATGAFGSWTGVLARSTACAIAAMSPFEVTGAAGGSSPASWSAVFLDQLLPMPAESRNNGVAFDDAAKAGGSIETAGTEAVPVETGMAGGLPECFA